jgi:hypothetical protein
MCVIALSRLATAAINEDAQGVVQRSLDSILSLLVATQLAIEVPDCTALHT